MGRYFRHVIFWLHMQDNMINIPLIVQDCLGTPIPCRMLRSGLPRRQDGFIRMMCILLKPHEVEAGVLLRRFLSHPGVPLQCRMCSTTASLPSSDGCAATLSSPRTPCAGLQLDVHARLVTHRFFDTQGVVANQMASS